MKEIWKPIRGFPKYEISNLGQVKSFMKGYPHLLKSHSVVSGYPPKFRGHLIVYLCKNGNGSFSRLRIHHLVLEAFVGPRPFGYECNHKNNLKWDNRPENLEWVTHAENIKHAVGMGLIYRKWTVLKNNEIWLMERLLTHGIKRKIISKIFRVKLSYVHDVALGRTHSVQKGA